MHFQWIHCTETDSIDRLVDGRSANFATGFFKARETTARRGVPEPVRAAQQCELLVFMNESSIVAAAADSIVRVVGYIHML